VKVFVSNFKVEKRENFDNAFYVFLRKKSRFFEFPKKT